VIDEFERQVYSLESVEGYTSEDFDAIMEAVCEKYGGASYIKNSIVDINMYWRLTATNSPVYYISYAVSNTESLNIFAIAEQDEAAARELYRILIEETEEVDGFLSAVDKAGLASPFEEELFEGVLEMMLK
jgi:oligoendopeptidase F